MIALRETPRGLDEKPHEDSTVAFDGDIENLEPGDGFPAVVDLADQRFAVYRMKEVIGRGSMSRVYRAEHDTLHRPCAVKILNPELLRRRPEMREQFWAEARVAANLVHPNIVTVHNLGSDRGLDFIEMEYVDGRNLRDVMKSEGPFDTMRASSIVHQVVEALRQAHGKGLVHRDVKPTNVLLTKSGQAKLADFGLVRGLRDLPVGTSGVAGTPTYMAPELFRGAPACPRSDLYAVGVMYYYLLSSRAPFRADSINGLIQRHASEPIPDVREVAEDVHDDVHGIIERCLAKQPAHRYESAEELADDLRSLINGLQDTESLVREALDGVDCFLQGSNDHHWAVFRLPEDRLQEVYLDVSNSPKNERILSVFSVCGEADPTHFEYLLRLNSRLTYGSLSIREVNGRSLIVMTRTFDRSRVTPAEVRAAMLEIAKRSDRLEQRISSGDMY